MDYLLAYDGQFSNWDINRDILTQFFAFLVEEGPIFDDPVFIPEDLELCVELFSLHADYTVHVANPEEVHVNKGFLGFHKLTVFVVNAVLFLVEWVLVWRVNQLVD